MNLNERCLLKFLQLPDDLEALTVVLENFNKEVGKENGQKNI